MAQPAKTLRETPSQTAGPYVHIGCVPSYAGLDGIYPGDLGQYPISQGARGELIEIVGSVFDGAGCPMHDVLLESWQADAAGIFPGLPSADPAVSGFGRFAVSLDSSEFKLKTVKPGRVAMRDRRVQAPHIALWIMARGINLALATRLYFPDEDNRGDPLLSRIEQPARAETLIAQPVQKGRYRFDIRIQGPDETVFLDI
ncbi:MAG: protocatechuate 3,4-dioxygenase subunit alpha [Pseudomonadota bacterium]